MGQMEVYVEYFVNLLFTLGTYVHCYCDCTVPNTDSPFLEKKMLKLIQNIE